MDFSWSAPEMRYRLVFHIHQSSTNYLKTIPQFKKLAENILHMPGLLADPRFLNNSARVKNRNALVKIITNVLLRNTRDYWLSEFEGLG